MGARAEALRLPLSQSQAQLSQKNNASYLYDFSNVATFILSQFFSLISFSGHAKLCSQHVDSASPVLQKKTVAP